MGRADVSGLAGTLAGWSNADRRHPALPTTSSRWLPGVVGAIKLQRGWRSWLNSTGSAVVSGIVRIFLDWQIRLSRGFDRWLPQRYTTDGNDDFKDNILPIYITRDMVIYDVGGGRRPYVDVVIKKDRNLKVVGVDIDAEELNAAPTGAYDAKVCVDITEYRGNNDADLVICQATLEHVRDTEKAFSALATIPKPGGRVAIFVPSRNALFARLNLLLPDSVKRFLLFRIFPHKAPAHEGFKAYYDKCTPRQFARMATRHGFEIELQQSYFMSSYLSFFLPAYALWRFWILGFHAMAGDCAAETFVMVLRFVGNAGRP